MVSAPSSQKTLEIACAQTETENCLPQKLFDGHLLSLIGHVDAVFVPRIISIVRGHNCCPRFGALYDATRAGIAGGTSLITTEINETKAPLKKNLLELARNLGADRKTAKRALRDALDAMERHYSNEAQQLKTLPGRNNFLLLGHPYTLHDNFIGKPIVKKMNQLQAHLELMTFADNSIRPGQILWCVFNKMFHKLQNLDTHVYAGVIQISTFNCGADSMMVEKFRRLCRQKGLPYLPLMVDEHAGSVGIDTRLETFVDSLYWKRTEGAT